MSYQITEEEKNRVKLSSPYVLPDSPTSKGMTAAQIKEYHYKALLVLMDILNKRLETIYNDKERLQTGKSTTKFCAYQFSLLSSLKYGTVSAGDLFFVPSATKPGIYALIVESTTDITGTSVVLGDDLDDGTVDFQAGVKYRFSNTGIKLYCLGNVLLEGLLNEHLAAEDAHSDIRGLIAEVQGALEGYKAEEGLANEEIRGLVAALGEALEEHKSDEGAHEDIRELVSLAEEAARAAQGTADTAYNLARGRTKVHVSVGIKEHIYGLLHQGEAEGYNEGDILLSAEGGVPDFIIIIKGSGFGGDYYEITDADALPVFNVGQIYKVGDYAIAAIESGIDTSNLATKEELEALSGRIAAVERDSSDFAESVIENYVTKEELGSVSDYLDAIIDLQEEKISGGEAE